MLTNQKRIHLKRAMEMVIMHHLGILRELTAEFDLELHVVFIPLEKNRMGTRLKKAMVGNSIECSEENRCGLSAGGARIEEATQHASH